jgi:hypothetical protein
METRAGQDSAVEKGDRRGAAQDGEQPSGTAQGGEQPSGLAHEGVGGTGFGGAGEAGGAGAGGAGLAAGTQSAHAGGSSTDISLATGQRRRSSVAVVSFQSRQGAAGVVADELWQTAMALGLSLLVIPLQLLSHALVLLSHRVLTNVRPSPQCGVLLMDQTNVSCVVGGLYAIACVSVSFGLVLSGALRAAPSVAAGSAAHLLLLLGYSSFREVGSAAHFVLCYSSMALHMSVVVFSIKLRRRWRRVARALRESLAFGVMGMLFVICVTWVCRIDLTGLAGCLDEETR